MKKIRNYLFGFFGTIAFSVIAVFALSSGAAGVANDFFSHLKVGASDDAWSLLSKEFQDSTTPEKLQEDIAGTGLTEVTDTTWISRGISPGEIKISGTVTTISGDAIPVAIDLVKEEGNWRIQYLKLNDGGASTKTGEAALTPPSEAAQLALVKESLTVFGESVNGKDFSPFVDHISETWKKGGVTAEQLNQAFASFIDQEVDILPALDGLVPAFDNKVVIADDGVMSINGVYASISPKIKFEFDYIKEGTVWKMISTGVEVE